MLSLQLYHWQHCDLGTTTNVTFNSYQLFAIAIIPLCIHAFCLPYFTQKQVTKFHSRVSNSELSIPSSTSPVPTRAADTVESVMLGESKVQQGVSSM